jgi:hypothetical protein
VATAWFARSAATKANRLTRSPGRKKRKRRLSGTSRPG